MGMKKYSVDMERIKRLEESDFSNPETKKETFSLIETLCGNIIEQNKRIQELEDEINRLKGEKGKPSFKAGKKEEIEPKEKETMKEKPKKEWSKDSKTEKIKKIPTCTVLLIPL